MNVQHVKIYRYSDVPSITLTLPEGLNFSRNVNEQDLSRVSIMDNMKNFRPADPTSDEQTVRKGDIGVTEGDHFCC